MIPIKRDKIWTLRQKSYITARLLRARKHLIRNKFNDTGSIPYLTPTDTKLLSITRELRYGVSAPAKNRFLKKANGFIRLGLITGKVDKKLYRKGLKIYWELAPDRIREIAKMQGIKIRPIDDKQFRRELVWSAVVGRVGGYELTRKGEVASLVGKWYKNDTNGDYLKMSVPDCNTQIKISYNLWSIQETLKRFKIPSAI